MITRWGLPLAAVFLLAFAVVHVMKAQQPQSPLAPPAQPPKAPYAHTVAGTGLVEPQTENISVGSQVPGVVVEVFVKVNQKVKANDPLFRLDDRDLRAMFRLKQAELAQAQSQLTRLKQLPRDEDRPVARAKVTETEANLKDKASLYERSIQLRQSNAVSVEELTSREQMFLVARAQAEYAKAQLELLEAGTWKYDLQVAEQTLLQAQAQIDQVQTNIDRLVVRALVDGEVLQLNVRPGEYVGSTPGQAFVVLGNVDKLHVRASIDEYDIPRFRAGAKARAMLKGMPERQYALTFVRVEPFVVPKKSLTGENTERVDTRVLQVIYSVDATSDRLYVGQQLDVFIDADASATASR
ncbi:MAG: efflux RND transporter periplasmic adaptor subunit [Planctomycetia bacterium]|nr:efflux RND transporter periplasmic adaptor subunit [Planctomycetia bacterium]